MQIVLLAAGMGTRLKDFTSDCPKCLVPLGEKVILDYVLETFSQFPADEIIIIGGYAYDKLQDYFAQKPHHKVKLVYNADFEKGSVLTLEKALPLINQEFFLFNADHIYPQIFAKKFLQNRKEITAYCDFDRILTNDDMKIQRSENRITAISKQLNDFSGGYIGVTYIAKEKLALYKSAIAQVITDSHGEAMVEQILAQLIRQGDAPYIGDTSGTRWLEIDTPEDRQIALAALKEQNLFSA